MKRFLTVVALATSAIACGRGSPGGPTINNRIGGNQLPPTASSVVSTEILEREPVANTANVKHILVSWKDLGDAYGGRQDPRAQARSKQDAEAEVRSLIQQLKAGGDFDALMKAHSEDTGSAAANKLFAVTPDAQLVIEFRQLALRLSPGELGVCQSDFGFHIIKRFD